MANNEDIKQRVIIDYENNAQEAAKDINVLDDSIEKVDNSQKKAIKTNKDVKKTQDDATKSSKDQAKGLESLGGPIGGAISGFKAMLKQMWLIVANPIGLVLIAIVGSLALLFKAFTSTNAGADKFEQVMAGISATIDILRDRVLKVGSAIAKFFSGDFAGAVADGKAAVSGFGDEVAAEFKKASDATKSLQDVADAMRDLGVSRAELNKNLVEAKEIIDDETASYKDKNKAIDEVRKAETAQTEKELENAKKKLKAIQDLNALSDTGDEDLQKEADAKTALFNLEEESARNKIKFGKLQRKADNEERSRLKEISTARIAAIKAEEDARKIAWDEADKRREEKIKREADLAAEEKKRREEGLAAIAAIEAEAEQKEIEAEDRRLARLLAAAEKEKFIEQYKLDQKKAIRDAEIGLMEQGLNLLSSIFGKNKKVQKGILIAENALGIAKTVINTQAANATTIAEGAALAIPTAGASVVAAAGLVTANNISAGISIASIIAATAKGLSALGGGSAGGGGGGGLSKGSSSKPSVGFQASSENQIATSVADNTNAQEPVKAYVVSKDMTTAQDIDRNKVTSNSLG